MRVSSTTYLKKMLLIKVIYELGAESVLIYQHENEKIRTKVLETQVYKVEVQLDGETVDLMDCERCYASNNGYCKYMFAVLLVYGDRPLSLESGYYIGVDYNSVSETMNQLRKRYELELDHRMNIDFNGELGLILPKMRAVCSLEKYRDVFDLSWSTFERLCNTRLIESVDCDSIQELIGIWWKCIQFGDRIVQLGILQLMEGACDGCGFVDVVMLDAIDWCIASDFNELKRLFFCRYVEQVTNWGVVKR